MARFFYIATSLIGAGLFFVLFCSDTCSARQDKSLMEAANGLQLAF